MIFRLVDAEPQFNDGVFLVRGIYQCGFVDIAQRSSKQRKAQGFRHGGFACTVLANHQRRRILIQRQFNRHIPCCEKVLIADLLKNDH